MNRLIQLLASTAVTASALAQDCSNLGTPLGSGDEVVFPIQAIGFAFPLGGATYTHVHVATNGHAFLSNGGVPAPGASDASATTAEFAAGSPRIAPLWTDLDLIAANGGQVYIENTSGTTCTITWKNAVNFSGVPAAGPRFDVQVRLHGNGDVEFFYSADATNGSALVSGQPGIVGITPGMGAALPAASDLSVGGSTADVTLFEAWLAPQAFDLDDDSLQLIATNPGYAFAANGPQSNCARVASYGTGCIDSPADVAHELFPLGAWDITATAITFVRTATEYTMLDALPGSFVTPTAAATLIANGDDVYQTVMLSGSMPTVGGSTQALTVCSNGFIALSPNQPSAIPDYAPSVQKLEAFREPTICGPWYDYNVTAGGRILFEEISGIAYVTWNDVVPYQHPTGDTFQYQFEIATGNVTIFYQSLNLAGAAAWHTPLLGYTAGDAGSFVSTGHDLSVDLANTILLRDGGMLPLALTASIPALGASWALTTSDIDPVSALAVTFFGDGRSAVPGGLPLATIGIDAPGCFVHINALLFDLTGINTGGVTTISLPIPNNAGLAGAIVTAQSLCLTLANGAHLLTSNGVEGRLGH